jgi:hypothetical protein
LQEARSSGEDLAGEKEKRSRLEYEDQPAPYLFFSCIVS